MKIIELVLVQRSSRKKPVYFLPKTSHLGLALPCQVLMHFFNKAAESKLVVVTVIRHYDLMKLFLLLLYLQEMMKVLYMEDAVANLKDTDISPGKLIIIFRTTNF